MREAGTCALHGTREAIQRSIGNKDIVVDDEHVAVRAALPVLVRLPRPKDAPSVLHSFMSHCPALHAQHALCGVKYIYPYIFLAQHPGQHPLSLGPAESPRAQC